MNPPQPRLQLLVLACAIAALWLGAFGIDAATRLMTNFYVRMNADLPDGTVRTVHAVQAHAHWLGAAFGTLLLGALFKRRPAAFAPAAALVLAVALLAATAAAFTLAWPTGLCGEMRPAWYSEKGVADECRREVR
ncbi:MAG: hypothetical protein IT512_10945 [Rhodocyclaceae bacterium]|nr:hypothetical protein [Rhodocyclaceae bacterium]